MVATSCDLKAPRCTTIAPPVRLHGPRGGVFVGHQPPRDPGDPRLIYIYIYMMKGEPKFYVCSDVPHTHTKRKLQTQHTKNPNTTQKTQTQTQKTQTQTSASLISLPDFSSCSPAAISRAFSSEVPRIEGAKCSQSMPSLAGALMGIMVWENLFQRRTAPQQGEHQGVNVKQVRESSEKMAPRSTPFCSYVREQPTTCYP